ncbi:receptor-like protein kinase FERONIA [Malania oleifera]|uniref:receptor-like protein kinase FERONIA n=1 Tax=Malania oleifera TaxID=397392 RepID=UPI0025AE5620|nr:receptor-like protein kinase FERONIA [Malania oleifera]
MHLHFHTTTTSITIAATTMNNLLPPPLLCLLYLSTHFQISRSYTPAENIAINCGSPTGAVAPDGRSWTGDNPSKFLTPEHLNSSSTSKAFSQDSAPPIPYITARISYSKFSYTFPVTAGLKFLRLHFHSSSYSALNISESFFSVTVNHRYTLLHNFSALFAARFLNKTYFFKEFCVNIETGSRLNLTFSPSSPGHFAFINGIEVVSMPERLYLFDRGIHVAGQIQDFSIENSTALEMVYRLNVKGQAIPPADDSGMFRAWSEDDPYVLDAGATQELLNMMIDIKFGEVPNYTAPEILYRTARSIKQSNNLTWVFPVDSGFYYLIRLHFCEIVDEIMGINQRVFKILLNNQTADEHMDIMGHEQWSGRGFPIYREFVVMVPESEKQDLWLALRPVIGIETESYGALLNGLEIFKINNSKGSFTGPSPSEQFGTHIRIPEHPKKIRMVLVVGAAVLGGAIAILTLFYFVFQRRKAKSSLSREKLAKTRSQPRVSVDTSHWPRLSGAGTVVESASWSEREAVTSFAP